MDELDGGDVGADLNNQVFNEIRSSLRSLAS